MSKKTHTNPLSKKETEILRKNPYIASVTANTVRFTEAFKELAYEKKCQGVPLAETMRQCGIDPEILGASRVEGFSYTLNKKAKQKNGFADGRSENYRRPPRRSGLPSPFCGGIRCFIGLRYCGGQDHRCRRPGSIEASGSHTGGAVLRHWPSHGPYHLPAAQAAAERAAAGRVVAAPAAVEPAAAERVVAVCYR